MNLYTAAVVILTVTFGIIPMVSLTLSEKYKAECKASYSHSTKTVQEIKALCGE